MDSGELFTQFGFYLQVNLSALSMLRVTSAGSIQRVVGVTTAPGQGWDAVSEGEITDQTTLSSVPLTRGSSPDAHVRILSQIVWSYMEKYVLFAFSRLSVQWSQHLQQRLEPMQPAVWQFDPGHALRTLHSWLLRQSRKWRKMQS